MTNPVGIPHGRHAEVRTIRSRDWRSSPWLAQNCRGVAPQCSRPATPGRLAFGLADLEIATAERVDWFNHGRLFDYYTSTSVEAETAHCAHLQTPAVAGVSN